VKVTTTNAALDGTTRNRRAANKDKFSCWGRILQWGGKTDTRIAGGCKRKRSQEEGFKEVQTSGAETRDGRKMLVAGETIGGGGNLKKKDAPIKVIWGPKPNEAQRSQKPTPCLTKETGGGYRETLGGQAYHLQKKYRKKWAISKKRKPAEKGQTLSVFFNLPTLHRRKGSRTNCKRR